MNGSQTVVFLKEEYGFTFYVWDLKVILKSFRKKI